MFMEWTSGKINQTKVKEAYWDSIWSISIFSQFQYMTKAPRCSTWDGLVFANWPFVQVRGI